MAPACLSPGQSDHRSIDPAEPPENGPIVSSSAQPVPLVHEPAAASEQPEPGPKSPAFMQPEQSGLVRSSQFLVGMNINVYSDSASR